jgi:hypothetical protein
LAFRGSIFFTTNLGREHKAAMVAEAECLPLYGGYGSEMPASTPRPPGHSGCAALQDLVSATSLSITERLRDQLQGSQPT